MVGPGILKSSWALLVSGSPRLRVALAAHFWQEGFQIKLGRDYPEGLTIARRQLLDVVVLDGRTLPAPGFRAEIWDGVPVIILLQEGMGEAAFDVHRRSSPGRVTNLPLSTRPRLVGLQARAALARQGGAAPVPRKYHLAGVKLDREKHLVTVHQRTVDLTPTEFDLLAILMAAPGQAFSRKVLLERVLGPESGGRERTIDVHIKNLRVKLMETGTPKNLIETVFKVGYRFDRQADMDCGVSDP